MATLYQQLGVTRDASTVDIEAAFREKLADIKSLPRADPEVVDRLREAYHVLANPARRQDYDDTLPRVRVAPEPASLTASLLEGRAKWIVGAVLVVAIGGWLAGRKPAASTKASVGPAGASSANLSGAGENAATATGTLDPSRRHARAPDAEAMMLAKAPPTFTGSAEEVFSGVSGSIASVRVLDANATPIARGSGVVIGAGNVLTNCHVTAAAHAIVVKVGGEEYPATVASTNTERDLCRLSVSGLSAPVPPFASVTALRVGQRVYAVGAPHGLELTLSEGIVSSLREVPGGTLIQTTAPISPGSSGGGLFDAGGRLVGIVTFQHAHGQNLNFALPADWAFEIARE